jgi:hypothetical protein
MSVAGSTRSEKGTGQPSRSVWDQVRSVSRNPRKPSSIGMSHPDLNQESVHSAAHTQALSGCQEILPGFGVTGKREVGYRVRDRGRETVDCLTL